MSRIGKKPIPLPKGVTVREKESVFEVKGPKGTLSSPAFPEIGMAQENGEVVLTCVKETPQAPALYGLCRALLASAVQGVSQGFEKTLLLSGVGYRAQKQGKKVALQLGFSHPVEVEPPEGVEVTIQGNNCLVISGIDKQKVGQVASNIRKLRPVEPYKGKGIRYDNEQVRRKAGKAGKVGAKAA